jgi:hypothetical protein
MMILLPIVLALLTSCAPMPEVADSAVGAKPAQAEGVLRRVGSQPLNARLILAPEEGEVLGVSGPLLVELEHLEGALVRVEGRWVDLGEPFTTRTLEVADYEVLAIDGRAVVIGIVSSVSGDGGRMITERGEEVIFAPLPPGIEAGQKIWIQGPQRISVQRFGTIRP